MKRSELARENFLKGYNCAQAVTLAFKDEVDLNKEDLSRLISGFGGGIGRLRETCGCVSAMALIISLKYGYSTPETGDKKKELYSKIQEPIKEFERVNGSLVCRELLGLLEKHSISIPQERTDSYYKERPCLRLVESAASILEDYLNSHEQ